MVRNPRIQMNMYIYIVCFAWHLWRPMDYHKVTVLLIRCIKNDKFHVRILFEIRGNMKRNKKMGSSLYDFTNYDVTEIEEEEEINNLR